MDNGLGLSLTVIWFDEDVLELKLHASNVRFSGIANFYSSREELVNFAKGISDFPIYFNDVRKFEFGGTELSGYGGAKISFSCMDRRGHILITVDVYSKPLVDLQPIESASVRLLTTPSELDCFVRDIITMDAESLGTAFLSDSMQ